MTNPAGVEITGPMHPRFDEILTPEALDFLADAAPRASTRAAWSCSSPARRREARAGRPARRSTSCPRPATSARATGGSPSRRPAWSTAGSRSPARPTAKMTINALNSGAKVWLADLEDANTPLWENVIGGQLNLRDAHRPHASTFTAPRASTTRWPDEELATHRGPPARLAPGREAHPGRRRADCRARWSTSGSTSSTAPSGSSTSGTGPYFYLPKMECHLEARLWNDVFVLAQERLGIPRGHDPGHGADRDVPGRVRDGRDPLRAARALRRAQRRPLGLHVQRDQEVPHPGRGLPAARPQRGDDDRAVHARVHRAAGADLPPARRARDRRHGRVHPQPARPARSTRSRWTKVRDDKTREAGDGFDGSWVAHPDLVPVCREVFDGVLGDRPNQLDRLRDDVAVTAADLLDVRPRPGGTPRPGCATRQRRRAVPGGLAAAAPAPWRSTT